ncbi:MAG: protoheme IX farnesyltransferase [Robiginitomaculum sp.]|nr:protoheme IX farnesyltransferase [Robiginitomaculum sp.]
MSETVQHHSGSLSGLGTASPGDYYALMKPRVMSLVVFTAMVGLLAAPQTINPVLAITSIFFIAVGAGAAGALNMWYDRDIDAVMSRTRKRPLPAGKMTPSSVLAFGIIMSFISVLGLAAASNYLAAGLLAFTIFYYFVVYSIWLKRKTPQNIVIGGAAGAFPPMVGWAAAGGGITSESLLLFAIILLWTPPHFWALALYKQGDYAKAGIPMMPNVKGAKSTRLQILVYAVLLVAASAFIATTSLNSPLYMGVASLLNLAFLVLAFRVWRSKAGDKASGLDEASLYKVQLGEKTARNLFAYSIIYLFALFGAIAAGQVL